MLSQKLFMLLAAICVVCMLLFISTYPSSGMLYPGNHDIRTHKTDPLLFNNRSIKAKKWMVVTTISNPTPDIKFLSKIPGWTVVVVGDTNTPNDWRLPNCIFLSLEEQKSFKSELVPLLPTNSYARKNVGYLFAIAHGAEVIYETDDDNRPLDLLQTFVLDSSVWGLLYAGKGLFNPYHHFGQPTLWPRGYPLSSVGENISTEYILNHWKTPSIQQGVVNGDPDMDAIFRLTRKQTHSQLNVTFDDRAPPAIVPAGVFSPFNSQNTLFLYDALWALLIPTTTTFRVCDIWRGYWAQRLLWEMGGTLGFFPPNAFQKRNSHSYMKDAVDEKDLYFQTERLLEFLRHWRCEPEKSFFTCMEKLSTDMAHDGFWEDPDRKLTARWIKDLRTIGYKEPGRIPYGSHKEGSEFMKELILPNQVRITDKMVNVTFWAAEQIAPLNSFAQSENPKMLSQVSKIASYCKNTSVNWLAIDYAKKTQSYQNILLIVVFGNPFYKNIPFLETMYSMYFPHTVYCGPSKDLFDNQTASLLKPVSFIELEVGGGWFAHNCLIKAIEMHYNVDGYLYIGDDTLLNVWNLHNLPFDKLWLFDATVFQQSVKPNWHWILNPKVGLNVYQASNVLDKQRYETFTRMLEKNTGKNDGFYGAVSDIAYVPKRYKNDVIYFMNHFSKFDLFVEIIFPTVFGGIEKWENVIKLRGTYLWYGGERDHIEEYFNKSSIFIHPVKLSKEIYSPKGKIFFCETFFPLILSHG